MRTADSKTLGRLVAAAAAALASVAYVGIGTLPILLFLVGEFAGRIVLGPRKTVLFNILGIATGKREEVPVKLPSAKKFAQGVGLLFSSAALALYFWGQGWGWFVGALAVAAGIEAVFAICVGCVVYNQISRWRKHAERCEVCVS